MSNPYYNYSGGFIGDQADNLMGDRATKLGEILTITDVRNEASNTVSFIAFVNSFSQNFTSNWNTQEALGRMDDIATFKNTTRQISVTWDVPAGDLDTARENLNRCNALISMLYPTYTNSDTADGGAFIMSKPPLVRIQYSNLISSNYGQMGLKGYITSLSWTPILEMGTFHEGKKLYPKVITLSLEFTALHEPIATGGPTGYYNKMFGGLEPTAGWKAGGTPNAAGLKIGGWPFAGEPYNPRSEPEPEPPPPPVSTEDNAEPDAEEEPETRRERRRREREERRNGGGE